MAATEVFSLGNYTTTFAGNGTAARVYSGSEKAIRFTEVAIIQAPSTNAGNLYVGGSTVTTSGATQGLMLEPGDILNLEQFIDKKRSGVLDLKNIWVNNASNGDKFTVGYGVRVAEADI